MLHLVRVGRRTFLVDGGPVTGVAVRWAGDFDILDALLLVVAIVATAAVLA